jgi:hypothetical protein
MVRAFFVPENGPGAAAWVGESPRVLTFVNPPEHERSPAVAESENVYVKIGARGRLIERTVTTPADRVNLIGTGWVLKGSRGAPTKKDETAAEPPTSGLTNVVPTSQRAFAEAASADSTGGQAQPVGPDTSSAVGSAGAAADAKSQRAAKQS